MGKLTAQEALNATDEFLIVPADMEEEELNHIFDLRFDLFQDIKSEKEMEEEEE